MTHTATPCTAYSRVVGHGMGFNDWADIVRFADGYEITAGHQKIKTGDVFTQDIGNRLVRETLINKTNAEAKPGERAAFIVKAVNNFESLLEAAEKVLAGLDARIDAAPSTAKPVFDGIADLSDAINRARGLS